MAIFLTPRIRDAIFLAVRIHSNMTRKGDGLPYITHPIAVFGLLTHWGANEDTCIAGLLHDVIEDVPEDQKGPLREEIKLTFGEAVLDIVEGVTEQDKTLPWKERKKHYLEHLKGASQPCLLVSCADMTHNLISLVEGYKKEGEEFWKRFNANKQWKVWFIDRRQEILKERLDAKYTQELDMYAAEMDRLLSQPLPPEYLVGMAGEGGMLIMDPLYQEFWNHCMLIRLRY